jgi:hypothetical protein
MNFTLFVSRVAPNLKQNLAFWVMYSCSVMLTTQLTLSTKQHRHEYCSYCDNRIPFPSVVSIKQFRRTCVKKTPELAKVLKRHLRVNLAVIRIVYKFRSIALPLSSSFFTLIHCFMRSYCTLIDYSRISVSPVTLRSIITILNLSSLERCNERVFEEPHMQQNMLKDY